MPKTGEQCREFANAVRKFGILYWPISQKVVINENKAFTAMSVSDDGIGIFKNIKAKY